MIEVERKFTPTDQQLEKLVAEATFVEEKTFTDVYYDTADYALTGVDIWLRQRQGRWELKLPPQKNQGATDIYHEIIKVEEISEFLDRKLGNPLEKLIATGHIEPFAELTTNRKKFSLKPFSIDVDSVSAENLSYSLMEIEQLVQEENQKAKAAKEIDELAQKFSIPCNSIIPGKVLVYLKTNKKEHFDFLQEKGVVRSSS